ncbi:hypothetical protein KJZ61_01405 [Candidatus Dependentiae bacterium]|nr:hypothetical protein [Candidatus Dependentiae bacterium]
MKKLGFTLLECCTVCALCIVLLTLTWINFSCFTTSLIRTDLELLQTVCLSAQQRALNTHKPQVITIDVNRNTYSYNGNTFSLSAGIRFGIKQGTKGPPAHPKNLVTTSCTFVDQKIVCSINGIISSGTLYLTDDKQSTVYALSNAVAEVSHLRLYVYRDTWQALL